MQSGPGKPGPLCFRHCNSLFSQWFPDPLNYGCPLEIRLGHPYFA
ncbi:MAG: hypothetical protein K0S46_630 [Moraxellaceae bacterium]|jgi:hypothetical protein|nr:hypothetical protein [Moraxellaceae bacterium]